MKNLKMSRAFANCGQMHLAHPNNPRQCLDSDPRHISGHFRDSYIAQGQQKSTN